MSKCIKNGSTGKLVGGGGDEGAVTPPKKKKKKKSKHGIFKKSGNFQNLLARTQRLCCRFSVLPVSFP